MTTWNDYRLRKRFFWGVFLLWIPMGIVINTIAEAIERPWLTAVYAVSWMIAWAITGIWLARLRCPQCDCLMFIYGPFGIGNLWARHCYHCAARPPDTTG